ncbi:MAG: DUF4304 domain-containing protein, partial [Planctomycetaceae bacterium]|nr:DUF4304 domain-containing protein [Planctomycetaceae bacterium]
MKAIAPTLKLHGFKKKGSTWHRAAGGFIQVFNVQGSQWGKSFYLNLGIYIKALGDKTTPTEYECHIQSRVLRDAEGLARLNTLLNLENALP